MGVVEGKPGGLYGSTMGLLVIKRLPALWVL